MGNRAVVSVDGSKCGIYLHWNGGRESVNAFLRVAKDLGVRDPISDPSYFLARFAQIAANFFGGSTCVGVESLSKLDCDNGDNGHFIVGKGFEIVAQKHEAGPVKGSPAYRQAYEDGVYAEALQRNLPPPGKRLTDMECAADAIADTETPLGAIAREYLAKLAAERAAKAAA
jgi:hypothetical protein